MKPTGERLLTICSTPKHAILKEKQEFDSTERAMTLHETALWAGGSTLTVRGRKSNEDAAFYNFETSVAFNCALLPF